MSRDIHCLCGQQSFSIFRRRQTMWSETRRPDVLEGVVGHADVKANLMRYLAGPRYDKVVLLHGSPGIGKTTIALAAVGAQV